MLHRQRLSGPESIQYQDIKALYDILEIPTYERAYLLHLILVLDKAYMEWATEKIKKQNKKNNR
jgi:hypothetical protein